MRRTRCAACSGSLSDFLDLGPTPLADVFPSGPYAQLREYPLVAAVCESCWLVQLRDVVDDGELYGADYGFRTGASPASIGYFAAMAESLLKSDRELATRHTVEIACNDGTLLRNFAAAGCKTTGVDPSAAAAEAGAAGVIYAEPFSRHQAAKLADERGRAGLVLAVNVAAHVADPLDFMLGIWQLLDDDGVAVVEFQDLAALIAGCQYDHVYHEHRFFYSLASFNRLAALAGLAVNGWKRTPAQGGSLRVRLGRSHVSESRKRRDAELISDMDRWLENPVTYAGMQGRAEYARRQLWFLIEKELAEHRVIAGFGASAKSSTLLNFCGFTRREVQWVEDVTPGKIGCFTPGTGIPIYGPEDWPDTYLMLSWNYASTVIRRQRDFLDSGGRMIIPGAVPVLL